MRATLWMTMALGVALGGPATALTALAQPGNPHVPTEAELEQARHGSEADPERGYQKGSVDRVRSWWREALAWLRVKLRAIHLTPARLFLGLGILGALYTAGKNKRKVRWAVLAVFSYLLGIVGLAAMIFDWPQLS